MKHYNIVLPYQTFHKDLRWFVTEKMEEYFEGMQLMESSEASLTEAGVRDDEYSLRNDMVYMESTYFFVRMCFVLQIDFNMIGAIWKVVKNEKTGRRTQKCVLVEHRYSFKSKEWEDWNGPTRLPGLIFDWSADKYAPALDDLKRAGGFWKYVNHEMVEFDGVEYTVKGLSKSDDIEESIQHLDIGDAGSAFQCRKNRITIGIDRVWYGTSFEYHHCFLHGDDYEKEGTCHFHGYHNLRLFFQRLMALCIVRHEQIKANKKILPTKIRSSAKAEKAGKAASKSKCKHL